MSSPGDPGSVSLQLPDTLVEAIAQRAAAIVLQQLQGHTAGGNSPYLTIPEAAAYARCKRQRIDDLLSARRLTRHKEGRRTLILRAELQAHLAATTGPDRPPGHGSMFGPGRATVDNPGNRTL
jgi:excisionase family DNA binding protein